MPLIPGGQEIGIVYVAAPLGLTFNSPGILPTTNPCEASPTIVPSGLA